METIILKRFWSKVDKSSPSSCWVWKACKNQKGYGQVRVKKQAYLAHRFAYELAFGPIPPTMNVLHKCDNPSCVNPDHLFLGTLTDNNQDMCQKGRHGKNVGASGHFKKPRKGNKLTFGQVCEMRKRDEAGVPLYVLAEENHISQSMVSAIVNYNRWQKNLDNSEVPRKRERRGSFPRDR